MNTVASTLPRAAAAPAFRPWLARMGATVWRAFEASGRARAQRQLLDFADHCEGLQPELAKELRAAVRHQPPA